MPTKSNTSVEAEQVYFIYGRCKPAAIALAPWVLPVPAGPRKRKLRICMGFPVVLKACLQMSTTSSGMMYHSSSLGTIVSSSIERIRPPDSLYCPTKSLWSMASFAADTVTRPVFAKMVNSPAKTALGVYAPEPSTMTATAVTTSARPCTTPITTMKTWEQRPMR